MQRGPQESSPDERGEVNHLEFEKKIREENACWIWTGSVSKHGRPIFLQNRMPTSAARFAYRFYIGPIPAGKMPYPSCGNKLCVSHLKLIPWGRHRNLPPNTKYSTALVKKIRKFFLKGKSYRWLAKNFNVNFNSLNFLVNHRKCFQ